MDTTEITSTLLSILDSKGKKKISKELFTNNVNTKNTYLLYRALYDGFIDKDDVLKILIDKMSNNSYLAPCSFCLKLGANPNRYIRLPNYGEIHILSYTSIIVNNEPLKNNLIYMLLLAGSNPQLFNYKDSTEERSVSSWLRDNFPDEEIDVGSAYANLQAKNMQSNLREAALLMDKPDTLNIVQQPINSEDEEIIILARSEGLYQYLQGVKNTISLFNARAFANVVTKISPNYLMSNQIIMRMMNNKNNRYVLEELSVMLSFIINRGVYMDEEQYLIIKTFGNTITRQIDRAYKIPYWKKTCSNNDNTISNRLRALAISLGIEPNDKTTVCESIDKISKTDPQKAIVASLRRQKTIMLGEISNISELIDKPPNMVCMNRADFDIDPMGYNNLDVSTYRDPSGSIWCFLSDTYPTLILNRTNPYTGQPIPEDFLTMVNEKLEKLKDLGIYKTLPINKAIEELKKKDVIDNEKSNEVLQSMFRVMEINDINVGRIENSTVEDLQNILDNASIPINILPFTKKHTLFSLAWIFNLAADDELNDIIYEMKLI